MMFSLHKYFEHVMFVHDGVLDLRKAMVEVAHDGAHIPSKNYARCAKSEGVIACSVKFFPKT